MHYYFSVLFIFFITLEKKKIGTKTDLSSANGCHEMIPNRLQGIFKSFSQHLGVTDGVIEIESLLDLYSLSD